MSAAHSSWALGVLRRDLDLSPAARLVLLALADGFSDAEETAARFSTAAVASYCGISTATTGIALVELVTAGHLSIPGIEIATDDERAAFLADANEWSGERLAFSEGGKS